MKGDAELLRMIEAALGADETDPEVQRAAAELRRLVGEDDLQEARAMVRARLDRNQHNRRKPQ